MNKGCGPVVSKRCKKQNVATVPKIPVTSLGNAAHVSVARGATHACFFVQGLHRGRRRVRLCKRGCRRAQRGHLGPVQRFRRHDGQQRLPVVHRTLRGQQPRLQGAGLVVALRRQFVRDSRRRAGLQQRHADVSVRSGGAVRGCAQRRARLQPLSLRRRGGRRRVAEVRHARPVPGQRSARAPGFRTPPCTAARRRFPNPRRTR